MLTGAVTVSNNCKSVTNAMRDGQPLDRPDPAEFPDVEELFSSLKAAQLAGCRQVYALIQLLAFQPGA